MSFGMDVDFLGEQPLELAERLERLASDIRALAEGRSIEPYLADAPKLSNAAVHARFVPALVGVVTGHPLLGDRTRCLSSELFVIAGDRSWARTASRFYWLEGKRSRH